MNKSCANSNAKYLLANKYFAAPPWSAGQNQTRAFMDRDQGGWIIPIADERGGCAGKTDIPSEHVPYLSASEVMIHEQVLYQVYVPLPLPLHSTTAKG